MSSTSVLLAFTEADRWKPGIGDPGFVGWLTVGCYFWTALLTFRIARRCRVFEQQRERSFWRMLTAILVLLGINKQLDLQTWFTLAGKHLAQSQGWYEGRRVVQFLFIVLVAAVSLGGFLLVWRSIRARARQLWLPLLGLFLLLGFVVIRAASFHHVDQFLHFRLIGIKMNWLLELGAISVVALGALANTPRRKARRPAMHPKMA